MIDEFVTQLHNALGMPPQMQLKLLLTVLILASTWLLRRIVVRIAHARVQDPTLHYRWEKSSRAVMYAIVILLLGRVWFPDGFQDVATFLGLLSAGLAIALKDPVMNVFGWLFIIWRRPFVVGDRVQVGDHAGDVIDIRLFQFTLLEIGNWVEADQSTGRVIHVPNGHVFNHTLANYTGGFQYIWNEVPITVTFESNWERAKQILSDLADQQCGDASKTAEHALRAAAHNYLIFYSKLTPRVYTSIEQHGVTLTVRYLCEPRRRRGTSETLLEAVLREFAKHPDIAFAYPTWRFYDNAREGKSELRPPVSSFKET